MISPTIFENSSSLHLAAANYFLSVYQEAVCRQDAFHVALSGGSTPKYLYQLLAKPPYAEKIDWLKVHIYFGDERFVPHSHDESNFKMAFHTLLQQVELPPNNIHKVATDLASAELAAEDYQAVLLKHLPKNPNGKIQFDLVLLGLGPDGHTASLFPGTDILAQQKKLCDAVYVEKFDSWRTSLTLPAINQAKHILLLSEGAGKIDIVHELVNSKQTTRQYPVQMIQAENTIHWYIDKTAATRLS